MGAMQQLVAPHGMLRSPRCGRVVESGDRSKFHAAVIDQALVSDLFIVTVMALFAG